MLQSLKIQRNLQPNPTCQLLSILLIYLLLPSASSFTFQSVTVILGNSNIKQLSNYEFILDRTFDDGLIETKYALFPVSSTDTATIVFPSQYPSANLANFACSSISVNSVGVTGFSCSLNNRTITISNIFSNGSIVQNMDITLSNIINPFVAYYSLLFSATIANDISGSKPAIDILLGGALVDASIIFSGGIVNQVSDMIFTFTNTDDIPQDGSILIYFGRQYWLKDVQFTKLIPYSGILSCFGNTANINNSTIHCVGDYSTLSIIITMPFNTALVGGSKVTFTIKDILAPPSTQPADDIYIHACDKNQNTIDLVAAYVINLSPQPFPTFTIKSSINPFIVNSFSGGLNFAMTIPNYITFRDTIAIYLPYDTTVTYNTATKPLSSFSLNTTTYYSANHTFIISFISTMSLVPALNTSFLNFVKFKAPPSVRPTSTITFTILDNGFPKMIGQGTIAAIANSYIMTVTAISLIVNTYTSYTFTFTMVDALASNGYITLTFDPLLATTSAQTTTILSNLSVSISGPSIRTTPIKTITPTTINGQNTYLLTLTNLNTTSSAIPAQTISITVSNLLNCPSVNKLTYFYISTYYTSSSIDLVANSNYTSSLTLQVGAITLASITSTTPTTYSQTTLDLTFTIQNMIPTNGYILLVLPVELILLNNTTTTLSRGGTPISITANNIQNNNTIIIIINEDIASLSGLKISLSNIMTPSSTQPTASFVVYSYDSLWKAIDTSSNSLSLTVSSGNSLTSLSIDRSNKQNSQPASYTITLVQNQNVSYVTMALLTFKTQLLLSSLTTIFQSIYNSTTSTYSDQPVVFTNINSNSIRLTFAQTYTSTHIIILHFIINPPSFKILTSPINVKTLNNALYIFSQMDTPDITNDIPSSAIINTYTFSNYVFGQSTNLVISMKGLTNWPTIIYSINLQIPNLFQTNSVTCQSTIINLICSVTANIISVSISDSSNLPLDITFTINSLINPPLGSAAQTFTLTTYDSANNLIQKDNSTIVFANNCSPLCRTCLTNNSTTCLSCYTSTNYSLLYKISCLNTCPNHTLQYNYSCIDCDSSCLSCSLTVNNCLSCNQSIGSNYTFLYQNTTNQSSCLSNCPIGSYNISFSCFACNSSCATCNSTQCFTCQSTYYYYNGACLSSCPNNTYSYNFTCSDCSATCLTCQNSSTLCTSCPTFTFLYNLTCSSTCPNSNMYVSINQTCQICSSSCSTCANTANNCTSCTNLTSTPYYYNFTCLNHCPDYFYPNTTSDVCLNCSLLTIGCKNCSSNSTCLSCDSGLLYFSLNQSCLSSSPDGYIIINGTIVQCNGSCSTCSNTVNNCTSCSGNLSLYQNACLSTCPINLTVSVSNVCTNCSYPCSTCANSTSNCLSCLSNSSVYFNNFTSSCVNASMCHNGTYANSTTQICEPCNPSCLLCSATSLSCSLCSNSYYLISSNSTCSSVCPSGSVPANISGQPICQLCSLPCLTCNITASLCLTCSQINGTLFANGNGSCVVQTLCPDGTYANTTTFKCQSCISPCSSCLDYFRCTKCVSNYSLITGNSTCSTSCPTGQLSQTVNGSLVCLPCLSPCSTCSGNLSSCNSCQQSNISLFLSGNICVNQSSCINLTYPNTTTHKCQSCPSPCLTCSSVSQCISCISNYSLISTNSSCSTTCPTGQLPQTINGSSYCISCTFPCATCSGNLTACNDCQSNSSLFLSGHVCVNGSSCINLTYANTTTLKCQSCVSPCLSCSSVSNCSTCISGYYLDTTLNLCTQSCTNTTVGGYNTTTARNQCLLCQFPCSTCITSVTHCTSCSQTNSTIFLANGSCVNSSTCPSLTYPNTTTHICQACISPCFSCLSQSICSSCVVDYFLSNTTCRQLCQNGSFVVNSSGILTCSLCSSTCSSCSKTQSNCTSCSNSTYLSNGSCVNASTCPNNTFPNSINNSCTTCTSPCSQCLNTTICISCITGSYLNPSDNTCLTTCPNGTIAGTNSTSGIKSCLTCNILCSTCLGNQNNCTTCGNGTYLSSGTCVNSSLCPNDTYPNSTTYKCDSCTAPCSQCINSSDCSTCQTNYYFNLNKCITSCPNGTVALNSSSGGQCTVCTSPCTTCQISPSTCLTCIQNTTVLYLYNSTCVADTACANGTFPNSLTLKCESCISACASCVNSSAICLSCSSGFYLTASNNSCVSNCSSGSVAVNTSRTCQLCTSPCQTCIGSQTTCKTCQSSYYLITSNSTCSLTCPTNLIADNSTRSCLPCTSPCSTCSITITNCDTCISNFSLFASNKSCLTTCPNGYYTNSGVCSQCMTTCGTCSNNTQCLSCLPPLLLTNNLCQATCPVSNNYNVSNVCMSCAEARPGCINCSSTTQTPICYTCTSPLILFSGICTSTCPSGYEYQSSSNTCLAIASDTNNVLTNSLTASSIFPLPFTITGCIIFVACFMSKLQNKNTYIIGTAYSLYGFIQVGCLVFVIFQYSSYIQNNNTAYDGQQYLFIALMMILGLNLIGLTLQTYLLGKDQKFGKWLRDKTHFCMYFVTVIISFVSSYKFKMIMFSRLFAFSSLKAQLDDVQKFRVFNVMSFFGIIHQGFVLYVSAFVLFTLPSNNQMFLFFLDLIIINIINIMIALAVSSKDKDFFIQKDQDGVNVNKVMNIMEEQRFSAIGEDGKTNMKDKGMISRDHLLDEALDDEDFTLTMSDKSQQSHGQSTKVKIIQSSPNILKNNKSSIMSSESSHESGYETGNHLKRNSHDKKTGYLSQTNKSAVYNGQLFGKNKKQFEENCKISADLLSKTPERKLDIANGQFSNQKISIGANIFDSEYVGDHDQFHIDAPIMDYVPASQIHKQQLQQPQKDNKQQYDQFQSGKSAQQVFFEQNIQKNQLAGKQIRQVQGKINRYEQSDIVNIPNIVDTVIPVIREIKVYRGKQTEEQGDAHQIQQIDLTISKKQKQLIQLRKSIRKKQRGRERSTERHSRKNSKSKDKYEKSAANSIDFKSNQMANFNKDAGNEEIEDNIEQIQLTPSHPQLISSKIQKIQENINAAQGNNSKIANYASAAKNNSTPIQQEFAIIKYPNAEENKKQRLQNQFEDNKHNQSNNNNNRNQDTNEQNNANFASFTFQQKQQGKNSCQQKYKQAKLQQSKYEVLQSSIIDEEGDLKSVNNRQELQQPIQEDMTHHPYKLNKDANIPQPSPQPQNDSILQEYNKAQISPRQNIYQIQDLPQQYKQDRSTQLKHQNIFDYKKDESSLIEDQQSNKQKIIGTIQRPPPRRRHHHIKQQDRTEQYTPITNMNIGVVADEKNAPLQNKLKQLDKNNIYDGNRSFEEDHDALGEMLEKTQRNKSFNRSHLMKNSNVGVVQREITQQSRALPTQVSGYHQINDISTIKQSSDKQITQRKFTHHKPPLQSRPKTSQKNRMYITGLNQFSAHPEDIIKHSTTNRQNIHNKTAFDFNSSNMRSREMERDSQDQNIQVFPSSSGSNQMRFQSEELPADQGDDLPRKPTIDQAARRRRQPTHQKKEDQLSLQGSFARRSMKSYRSRSIDRDEAQEKYLQNQRQKNNVRQRSGKKSRQKSQRQVQEIGEGITGLEDYYNRKRTSSRSRSKSREGNRSSDKRMKQLQKIYLQKLQYKPA